MMTRVDHTLCPKGKWAVRREGKEENKERKKHCRHTETPIMIPLIPSKNYGWK